jgi:hypothetical protein
MKERFEYNDNMFDQSNCLTKSEDDKGTIVDELRHLSTEVHGGGYKLYNSISLQDNIDNFCHGGIGETQERARLVAQGIVSGLLGFIGLSEVYDKSLDMATGGSTEFKSMPNEILKAVSKKLELTKDAALYKTVCKTGKIDIAQLKLIKALDKEISVQLSRLKEEYEFELKEMSVGLLVLITIIISIVTFLLFY